MDYSRLAQAVATLRSWTPEQLMACPIWVHGNGFIQVDIGVAKLHVWTWHLKLGQKVHTPIHDHRFDFESTVITGILDHVTYKVTPDFEGGDYWRYQVVAREGENTDLVPAGNMLYRVRLNDEQFIYTGGSYEFKHGLFHNSVSLQPLTATVMVKTANFPHHLVRVMVPKHLQPDNEFNRYQRPSEELWPTVRMAVWG